MPPTTQDLDKMKKRALDMGRVITYVYQATTPPRRLDYYSASTQKMLKDALRKLRAELDAYEDKIDAIRNKGNL